jgi:hypothetical protein
MDKFWQTLILTFCIALGVNLGGSLVGAMGAIITNRPPLKTMLEISGELKIWALVAALGGTFGVIKIFEAGVFGKQFFDLGKQLFIICSAFLGAHLGYLLILSLGAEK